jgi:hypothetical protein
MEEDFAKVRDAPGQGAKGTSSRAWLEHRSKVQYHHMGLDPSWDPLCIESQRRYASQSSLLPGPCCSESELS